MDKRVWVIQGIIGRKDKVDPLRRHAADRIADQRLSRLERSPEVRPSPPSDNREAADPFGRTWISNRKEVGRWRPVGNAQYVVAIITSGIGESDLLFVLRPDRRNPLSGPDGVPIDPSPYSPQGVDSPALAARLCPKARNQALIALTISKLVTEKSRVRRMGGRWEALSILLS